MGKAEERKALQRARIQLEKMQIMITFFIKVLFHSLCYVKLLPYLFYNFSTRLRLAIEMLQGLEFKKNTGLLQTTHLYRPRYAVWRAANHTWILQRRCNFFKERSNYGKVIQGHNMLTVTVLVPSTDSLDHNDLYLGLYTQKKHPKKYNLIYNKKS